MPSSPEEVLTMTSKRPGSTTHWLSRLSMVRSRSGIEREMHGAGFPGLQRDAFESAQHLFEGGDGCDHILDVELDDLVARPVARYW